MMNSKISEIFFKIAELLEIKGDNPFRIRAYLKAAENMDHLEGDIQEYVDQGRLEEIPGIGHDLAAKIKEIIITGECRHYEELKRKIPLGVIEMLEVPGVGPKTVRLFFEELKLKSVEGLKKAAKNGRLLALPGIQHKTVENILKGIELVQKGRESMDLLTATSVSEAILAELKKLKAVEQISIAGSLRRMKDSVRDIDILVVSKEPKMVMDVFVALPQVKRVLAKGDLKSAILTRADVQVDLRVFDVRSFGAALLYFTGSKAHNIRLRQLALRRGLKINEYGIFNRKNRCLASRTEEEIYAFLKMDYCAPELREDTGEVEAALKGNLPRLITLKDIKGDLHVHTNYSDGTETMQDLADSAMKLGYDYICFSDHSVSLKVARGLDLSALKRKKRELDRLKKKMKGIKIFFGSEVEIDSDGRVDYDDRILSEFDIVIAAIHAGFKQSREQLTRRIVKACQNKHVHIVAHPTGRLWPKRDAYDLDFKEVFKTARDTNTVLEINAHPNRMDLADVHARRAREKGVKLVINTDAHQVSHFGYMRFGIGLARRAWLEKKDVLNTLGPQDLIEALKK